MSSKKSPSKKSPAKKKTPTRKVAETSVVISPAKFSESQVAMEEMKITKREIAEYLVSEQQQKLEDEIESINNRQSEISYKLNGNNSNNELQKFVKGIAKTHFSKKIEKMESLFDDGTEFKTNISGQLNLAQYDEKFTEQYPDIVKYFNNRNNRGYYNNNALNPTVLTQISLTTQMVHKTVASHFQMPIKESGSVSFHINVADLPEVQEFNKARIEMVRQLIQNESLIEEKRKALNLLQKNSRRLTSQIVKSELLKTEGGTKLLNEISSIVSGTLSIPAPK